MKKKDGQPTTKATAASATTLTCPGDKMPLALDIMRKFGISVDGGSPNPTAAQLTPALMDELAKIGAGLE